MNFRILPVLFCLSLVTANGVARAGNDAFKYVENTTAALSDGAVVIDTRSIDQCELQSLSNARCVPADDLLGPRGRMPSFADIAWVFGTAGLNGSEHVLVVGDIPTKRDFVAGVLYVLGQERISVLQGAVLTSQGDKGPGSARATTRTAVWQGPARNGALMTKTQLRRLLAADKAPLMVDGRSEKEYWGARVLGHRGGHLPGADHLPADRLRADVLRVGQAGALAPTMAGILAYAQGNLDGFAYLTLLRAGAGADVRVYPGGWSEWQSDGSLPIDAATYGAMPSGAAQMKQQTMSWRWLSVSVIAVVAMGAAGFVFGRRSIANKEASV